MPEVRAAKQGAVREWVRRTPRLLLGACAACLALALVAVFIALRHPAPAVVETVTTGLDTQPAAKPSPVINAPQLPARDEDVERAGDKIAEATVYVSRRQKTAALRALTEARTSARRAYDRRKQSSEPAAEKLRAALRELELAELAVEHGSTDAKQKLLALNQHLDVIDQ
jgi:hypothetical protein